jgi:arsenate reductase (glutaredoxin)
MKKVYYLATCSTCIRILKELDSELTDFKLQDIKTEKISATQIDQMKSLSGTFESLFSRRAMKYKSLGLASKQLHEADYRGLILDEYTFLKRPVFIIEDKIFIGNSLKIVEAVRAELS